MIYLDKVLSQLAYPLGLTLGLLVASLLLLVLGWRRFAGVPLAFAVVWLTAWSLPVVSDSVRLSLEGRFEELSAVRLPKADAVVVLGGTMRPGPAGTPYPNLAAAADRVWHAARLYHAGRAPVVIVSGGTLPWSVAATSEAVAMRRFLLDLGVPGEAVLLEDRSATTRENAVFTAELMAEQEIGRVLLVTSALHMRRALAAFQAVGVDAVAAPTDFEVRDRPRHLLDFLPDAEALEAGTRALKEYLGFWVYRRRGWI